MATVYEANTASVATTSDLDLAQTSSGTLSEDEAAGLLFMREEEKLAHDVYLALYAEWQLPIFQNIAGSEQTHTDSVLQLITRYGLDDPAAGLAAGEFTDPTLQSLYDQLVAQGSASLEAALRVGAAIEEIDILDLEERLAQTDKADIQRVYENLLAGSRNHLRAFVGTLEQQAGTNYTPQYLTQAVYDAIVSGTTGRGNSRNSSGNGGQGGGNGQNSSGSGGQSGGNGQNSGGNGGQNGSNGGRGGSGNSTQPARGGRGRF
ncbi:MAG: DUF2202 domain-containing protein [Anaerolineae bacterium]|nr:DUF2202 domain-containing protein [Anaerolineae bacterium]